MAIAIPLTARSWMTGPNSQGAAALGVSPSMPLMIVLGSGFAAALVYALLAVLLFRRRSLGTFALVLETACLYQADDALFTQAYLFSEPQWSLLGRFVDVVQNSLVMLVAFRFPDGRWIPRWTRVAFALFVMWQATRLTPLVVAPAPFAGLAILSFAASGVFAQVYRYRRSADETQRQQTRWFSVAAIVVVAALAALVLPPLVWTPLRVVGSPERVVYLVATTVTWDVASAAAATAVVIAVLKYGLYRIDTLINRAAIYAVVSAVLAGSAILFVNALQDPLETVAGPSSRAIGTLMAVLGAVLLFGPLRNKVRVLVDRVLPARERVTLFFTDIVGSTAHVAEVGDAGWRQMLDGYRAATRRELRRFGGREIDAAGDGFFAMFPAPLAALRCALAVGPAIADLGIAARTAVHVGQCEMRGEKPTGMQVHAAARIMGLAEDREILCSEQAREGVGEARIGFADRGLHQLRGVPGEWHLFAVSMEDVRQF